MRKKVIFGILAAVVLCILMLSIIFNKVGYTNLSAMYELNTSDKKIVFTEISNNGNGVYLTLGDNLTRTQNLLIERMEDEGWSYTYKDGSGLFFSKEGKDAIVTVKRWHRKYFILDVKSNLINIGD